MKYWMSTMVVLALFTGCGPSMQAGEGGDEETDTSSELALSCTSTPAAPPDETFFDVELTPAEGGHVFALTARDLVPGRPQVEFDGLPQSGETQLEVGTNDGEVSAKYEEWVLQIVELEDVRGAYVGTLTQPDGTAATAACWTTSPEPRFEYDAQTGRCVDENGVDGINEGYVSPLVRGQTMAQCADLTGLNLSEGIPSGWTLDATDFRGADLTDAKTSFSNISDARFEGSDLEDFQFGYSEIDGTVDEFTVLPADSETACEEGDGTVFCRR